MKMTFTERKVSISDELKEYAAKKCEKLERYFDRDNSAKVTFSMERGRYIAEITVVHAGMLFRASEQSHDMYGSIDGAVDSIERQILKNKTRLEKRLRQGAFDKSAELQMLAEDQAPEDIYDVIRVKEFEVKPMTVQEAILQMNLLDHQFFFFRNSEEDDRYSVVYKRQNGGYGLIISK